jgi:ankyrin repeat protein
VHIRRLAAVARCLQNGQCGCYKTVITFCLSTLLYGHIHGSEWQGVHSAHVQSVYSRQVTYRFAFDVNKADEEMRTPLFLAAQDGHVDVVKILLNFRLDAAMHSTNINGATHFRLFRVHYHSDTPTSGGDDVMEDVVVKDKDRKDATIGDSPLKRARAKLNSKKVAAVGRFVCQNTCS